MRIAVAGCGAVGSFYGAKLWARHGGVHFLLRSDYSVVLRQGVWIQSPAGSFRAFPAAARDPAQIGPVDLALVAVKSAANAVLPELIPPLLHSETRLLTLQNGLGNEDFLARHFGPKRVLGGLCFVCLNRRRPGWIDHIAFGNIRLGQFQESDDPAAARVARLFQDAGVQCELAPDLGRARWEKLLWNIPFNGLGVAAAAGRGAFESGGPWTPESPRHGWTTDRLLADPFWSGQVRDLMEETMTAARALGHEIDPGLPASLIERTARMGAYKPSSALDFEAGRPLEVESLFGEPLRRARANGAAAPRLERLYQIVRALDAGGGFVEK